MDPMDQCSPCSWPEIGSSARVIGVIGTWSVRPQLTLRTGANIILYALTLLRPVKWQSDSLFLGFYVPQGGNQTQSRVPTLIPAHAYSLVQRVDKSAALPPYLCNTTHPYLSPSRLYSVFTFACCQQSAKLASSLTSSKHELTIGICDPESQRATALFPFTLTFTYCNFDTFNSGGDFAEHWVITSLQ